MVREDAVRGLARAGHTGMMPASVGTTGCEVVSALFLMCSQGIEVALKIGVTRESLRHAIHGLYMLVADDTTTQ